jgi:DNA-binding NtrC family response regulator
VERRKIIGALKDAGGDRGRASEILQIPNRLLTQKIRELSLE